MKVILNIYFFLAIFLMSFMLSGTSRLITFDPTTLKSSFLEEIIENQKGIAERLKKIPLYIGVRTDYLPSTVQDYQSQTPFEDALVRRDRAAINMMANSSVSIVGKKLRKNGLPLSYSVRSEQKEVFDDLLPIYKKLYLYEQYPANALETALALCDTNVDLCYYFLNRMFDNKFDPTPIKDHPNLDKPKLSAIKKRIADIIAYNSGAGGDSQLRYLIERCNQREIEAFLKDEKAQVDWQSKKDRSTALCHVSKLGECMNNKYSLISLLLKNGANANCDKISPPVYLIDDHDNLDPDWLQIFVNLFIDDHGANPFIPRRGSILAKLWNLKFVGNRATKADITSIIEKKYPHILDELALRFNIGTILGQTFKTDIFGSDFQLTGANAEDEAYEILQKSLVNLSRETLPAGLEKLKMLKNRDIMLKVQQSVDLSIEFLQSHPGFAVDDIRKKSQQIPVIIPAGWRGHAVAIIIYKNLLIKLNKGDRSPGVISGAKFYKIMSAYGISELESLIKPFASRLEPNRGKLLFDFQLDNKMRLETLREKEEPAQCMGNCTWESSASFALQLVIAILMVENYQSENPEGLVEKMFQKINGSEDIYEQAKDITDIFKRFASYNMVRGYILHALSTLETNKCLPDTNILTEVLKTEVDKATSFLGRNNVDYFQQKTIDFILKSGLPLKNFHDAFSLSSPRQLKYLLDKIGIPADGPLTIDTADKLYNIYDPRAVNRVNTTSYPWGQCFY